MRRFFAFPEFRDEVQNQLAWQLRLLLVGLLLGIPGIAVLLAVLQSLPWPLGAALAFIPFVGNLVLLAVARRGRLRAVSLLLVAESWLILTLLAFLPGALGARAAWGFFIFVFIAGMLLGEKASSAAIALSSLTTLAIAFFSQPRTPHPWTFWLINTLYLLAMILLQHLVGRSMRTILNRIASELHERQRAQAALSDSEKKHREMVNSLPVCIFETDLNGGIRFVNQTGLDWFGYSSADLAAGFGIERFLDDSEVERAKTNIGRMFSGAETANREYRVRRKDGSLFTALIRTQVITENGIACGLQGSLIDISAGKQAEQERELIISLLRATVESTADGILVVDQAGKIAHFNQRFKELWRLPDGILASGMDDQALAFVCDQLVAPQDFIDKVQQLYATPLAESFDLLSFKDGRVFERYSRPQMLAGRPVGRVWSFRDITESKRSEEALRTRNQFISSLLRAIPVAVFFKDRDGRYTGCNDTFTEIMGVTSDEIMGKKVHDLWPSELADVYHEKDLELMRERQHQSYEFQVRDRDGRLRPVIYAKDVFQGADGEVAGMVGAFVDITERKLAESALRESELRYRTLFEAASDAIFLMREHRIYDCNSRTLEMFGRPREQIIGASPDLFSPPFQPDGRSSREKVLEKVAAAFAGQPQFFEWVHCRADRTHFSVEISLNRIELSDAPFLLAIVRDITDRRRLEGQLLQAQKMEAIGILAGGVAHDFNNILSAIVGYGSLLKFRLQGDGQLLDYIERILSSCERAVSLTTSLLTFSRKQEVELQPVDINSVVSVFHEMLARLIGEDIEFRLELSRHHLVVEIDVRQFEQVLMNLVTNSRDAMPNGGRLTIATEQVRLEERQGEIPAGSYALITVADTGSGIAAGSLAHIFEPFFTTKAAGKGTGLGMSIVYGIIKKHNGFISVTSAVGQGTTFRIHLQLKPVALMSAVRQKEEKPLEGSETILLIEDDAGVRHAIRSILAEFGYQVIEAADGEEGVALFAREPAQVAVVLSDLLMPRMNGREAVAEIRRIRPEVKVIFMSGYEAEAIVGRGNPDPAIPMLQKPVQPLDLLVRLRTVIDS